MRFSELRSLSLCELLLPGLPPQLAECKALRTLVRSFYQAWRFGLSALRCAAPRCAALRGAALRCAALVLCITLSHLDVSFILTYHATMFECVHIWISQDVSGKNMPFVHLTCQYYANMIILPTQARDKHIRETQNRHTFLQATL